MKKQYFLLGQYHLYVQPVLVEVDADGTESPEELLVEAMEKVYAGEGINVLDPEYLEVTEEYGATYDQLPDELQEALINSHLVDRNGGQLRAIRDWKELTPVEAHDLLVNAGATDDDGEASDR